MGIRDGTPTSSHSGSTPECSAPTTIVVGCVISTSQSVPSPPPSATTTDVFVLHHSMTAGRLPTAVETENREHRKQRALGRSHSVRIDDVCPEFRADETCSEGITRAEHCAEVAGLLHTVGDEYQGGGVGPETVEREIRGGCHGGPSVGILAVGDLREYPDRHSRDRYIGWNRQRVEFGAPDHLVDVELFQRPERLSPPLYDESPGAIPL